MAKRKLRSRGPFRNWEAVPLTVSVDEACGILGVSRETFYSLVRSGALRTRKAGGRRIVSKSALREFVEDVA